LLGFGVLSSMRLAAGHWVRRFNGRGRLREVGEGAEDDRERNERRNEKTVSVCWSDGIGLRLKRLLPKPHSTRGLAQAGSTTSTRVHNLNCAIPTLPDYTQRTRRRKESQGGIRLRFEQKQSPPGAVLGFAIEPVIRFRLSESVGSSSADPCSQ